MSWPDDAEVSVVERGQYCDAFTLRYRNDRRINETKPEIRVLLNECDASFVIVHRQIDNLDITGCHET